MRVLMLTQFYPPFIGGAERFVRDLSLHLIARGHEVVVCTVWHEGLPAVENDEGVRVHRIKGSMQRLSFLYSDEGHRHAAPWPDPELLLGLWRIIRAERPDIVHAHDWMVDSFIPLKRWSKVRLAVTMHDFSLACAQKKLLYKSTERCDGPALSKCLSCVGVHYGWLKGVPTLFGNEAMRLWQRHTVDMFMPVSRALADGCRLAERGLPFEVVPNMVSDDVGAPRAVSDEYLSQLPGEGFLLFVGAFGRYKGIHVLLEAYAGIEDPPPLVLIGYDVAESVFQESELPPSVTVLRQWPNDAVMEAWRRCMIALVPSVCYDACPTTAIEAMSVGRPLIGSALGGLTDIIADEESGLLVPPDDPDALRAAIERLLDDPAQRERMGAAGRQRAVNFQNSAVVPKIERVYHDLIAEGRRA